MSLSAENNAWRNRERRLLQGAIVICAAVPVFGGLAGVAWGPAMLDAGGACSPSCDSHIRYLSGILLAIGFAFWSVIPRIEQRGAAVCMLTALVVTGGLARTYSAAAVGWPSWQMSGALVMELGVTPLLALWQARVARLFRT